MVCQSLLFELVGLYFSWVSLIFSGLFSRNCLCQATSFPIRVRFQ